MSKEMMDIVDSNDNIIGHADREEIYARSLLHRIVHVLIFNDKNELGLQLRSKNMNFCPGCWSSSVGGHVRAKETYFEAALREMKEEIGKIIPIKFFHDDIFSDPEKVKFKKFIHVYKAIDNGPFEIEKGKVDKIEFFDLNKISQMIAENRSNFHPELLYILEKYLIPKK